MQKGHEAHFAEEKNEAEVFQGALCHVSFSSSVAFSRQLHPALFHLVEAACAAQAVLTRVQPWCQSSSSHLSSPPPPGDPSASFASEAETLAGVTVCFGFHTVLLAFAELGWVSIGTW